jgi:hypothetical protein
MGGKTVTAFSLKSAKHLSSVLANGARSYARTDLPPGRAVGFSVFA